MDVMTISEMIPSIAFALMFYEYDKLDDLMALGYDEPSEDYYSIFYETLGITADAVWSDYLEDYNINTWYFSNRSMVEYYRLCRVYGSAHHKKLKDNPYILEAQRFVESTMDFNGSGGYGWWLNTKINHEWASGLIFHTDESFYGEFELVEALLEIQSWYSKAVYRLRGKMMEQHMAWLRVPQKRYWSVVTHI